jgi:hypothetical protein
MCCCVERPPVPAGNRGMTRLALCRLGPVW